MNKFTNIKRFIINKMPHTWSLIVFLYFAPQKIRLHKIISNQLRELSKNANHIFYCGRPMHSNLGDLAQYVCIRKWLITHFMNYNLVELPSSFLLSKCFNPMRKIKKCFNSNDFFVFQSGYTTTDLGGVEDKMHKRLIKHFRNKRIVFFPQTIYFKSEKRKNSTSIKYSLAKRMLFLARDAASYNQALSMFPNAEIKLFPDIVTTMIGNFKTSNSATVVKDVLFCLRNDSEKFFSDSDIEFLKNKCKLNNISFDITDTTKKANKNAIIINPKPFIFNEIDSYSHYKVVVTDRFHGTIFSMAANVPVIVLKTNDHKVISGIEWFKGIYDDFHLSLSIDDCFKSIVSYLNWPKLVNRKSYFLERYYSDNLVKLIMEL